MFNFDIKVSTSLKLCKTISLTFWSLMLPFACLAQSPNMSDAFKDVDRMHWAYSVAEQLRSHNVIAGYPQRYFTGGMALTRYEFASAIENSLHRFHSGDWKQFDATRILVPDGITPNDLKLLKRMSDEFRLELTMITGASDVPNQVVDLLVQRARTSKVNAPNSIQSNTQLNNSFTLGNSRSLLKPLGSERSPYSVNDVEGLGLRKGFGTVNPLDGNKYVPLSFVNSSTGISLGMFNNLSFMTPFRTRNEGYFSDSSSNLLHGVRATTNLGSVGLEAFSGTQSTVERQLSTLFSLGDNQVGIRPAEATGSILDHLTSFSAGIGSSDKNSHLRLTAIEASTGKNSSPNSLVNSALVLGTDAHLRSNAFSLNADLRTSSTGQGKLDSTSGLADYSSAFDGSLGINFGSISLAAGYRYVDPLFYSPGFWGRIGSWINPTNVQGPTFRANVDLLPGFGINVGGDFLSGVKDRSSLGGLSSGDDINRVLVGLRWDVGKNVRTTIDWEGVYWKLDPTRSAASLSSSGQHPTERYITLGTGYSLSNSTLFKLNYTLGDLGTRYGSNAGGQSTLFNSFSGQVSVKS